MSKRVDQRLVDINSLVMGSGVGIAALEAMFNVVNTQSLLSANMVRDFEMSHPVQMQALANALVQIMMARETMGVCEGAPVQVPPPVSVAPSGAAAGGGVADEKGAVSSLDDLNSLLDKSQTTSGDSTSTFSSTSMSGLTNEAVEKLLTDLLGMFREHLSDMTQNSKPSLAVT